jgi:hypothetical protein
MPDDAADQIDQEFLVAYDYGMGGLWAVLNGTFPEGHRSQVPGAGCGSKTSPLDGR